MFIDMKNNIKIGLFLTLMVASTTFFSCKKYLDVESPSRVDLEQLFDSPDNINANVLSIYSKVAGRNVYGGNLPTAFSTGGDDFWIRGGSPYNRNDISAVSTYNPASGNTALLGTFTQLYEGIERANIVCKNLPASNLYKTSSGEVKIRLRNYYGEALALRALFFFELIRHWGDVPASFVPAADRTDLFFGHADRDSTYDHILTDLKTASDLVGWRNELPAYKTFRFTKGAVKALRARIALFRGGYSLRTKSRMMQRKEDYLNYYRIAFDECNDIIKSNQHLLNPVFENIFKSLHSGTARFDDANEIMFEVAMWGGINDSDLARTYGLGFSNTTWGNGGGGARAVPTYFYEFERGTDVRRDVTLPSFNVNTTANTKTQLRLHDLMCGKFRKSWTQFDATSPSLQFGVNWPVIRFADVLLMYAEAANELQDFSGAITPIEALQRVQRRAYGVNPIPVTPLDKVGFFNALVKERLLEFGGEGIRRYDLIRWNLLDAKIKEVDQKLRQLAWAAPVTNNPYANYSEYIYNRPSTFTNKTYPEETATILFYGGTINDVLYTMNTVNPGGTYVRTGWRREVGVWTNGVLGGGLFSNQPQGWGTFFVPNSRELLPYPGRVVLESRGSVVQNFGYTE
jgi:hypothetical protein